MNHFGKVRRIDKNQLYIAQTKNNKSGTAQVGVISKAQKYSRNNYCEIFQLSRSAEKYPKNFPKLENSFLSELETSEKNELAFEKIFQKKYLVRKVAYCRKTQRETL